MVACRQVLSLLQLIGAVTCQSYSHLLWGETVVPGVVITPLSKSKSSNSKVLNMNCSNCTKKYF